MSEPSFVGAVGDLFTHKQKARENEQNIAMKNIDDEYAKGTNKGDLPNIDKSDGVYNPLDPATYKYK
jgi:hypothetical protein